MRWFIKLLVLVIFEFILFSGTIHFLFGATREASLGYACLMLFMEFLFVMGAVFEWRFSFVKWKKEYKDWSEESEPLVFLNEEQLREDLKGMKMQPAPKHEKNCTCIRCQGEFEIFCARCAKPIPTNSIGIFCDECDLKVSENE